MGKYEYERTLLSSPPLPSPLPSLPLSLLIELSPSYILKSDFLHGSVEEAFESAVHSVPERASLSVLWKEYLDFLKPRSPTPANVKVG